MTSRSDRGGFDLNFGSVGTNAAVTRSTMSLAAGVQQAIEGPAQVDLVVL